MKSKFVELSTKKLPHDKRVKRLYGEKDDTNKFFKCWVCGFTVDSKKHPVHQVGYSPVRNSFTDFPNWVNLMSMNATDEMQQEVVCEDNATNILIGETLYYSDTSVGCPHCGSSNYK